MKSMIHPSKARTHKGEIMNPEDRKWFSLQVKEIIKETPNTKTFILVDAKTKTKPFNFIAGQYLTFRFDDLGEKPIARSYTISSSPEEKNFISITVKEVVSGSMSHYMITQVKKGDLLKARGPLGKFTYCPQRDTNHLVAIAAGSGIAPFMSILKEYVPKADKDPSRSISVLVGYRDQENIINKNDLEKFNQYKNTKINITLSQDKEHSNRYQQGRISPEKINDLVDGLYEDKTFMLCGPQEMIESSVAYLKHKGVSQKNIRIESFAGKAKL